MHGSAKYYHYTKIPPFLFPQRILMPQGVTVVVLFLVTEIVIEVYFDMYCICYSNNIYYEIMYFVMMLTYITWLGCIWLHS